MHVTLKQANYDYERIQYNTVVSAGMKMLNTLEAVQEGARGGGGDAARGHVDSAAHALPRRPAHHLDECGRTLGLAAEYGDLLDAAWPEVDAAALAQRRESSSYCRSTASCAAKL